MDELDFYDEYGLELAEAPKRKRKRRRNPSNPEPIAIATPLLLLVAGYLGWVVYAQSKTGHWTFTPWKKLGIGRRRLLRAPNNAEAERQARQQAALDRATERMMAPRPSVIEQDVWKQPTYRRLFEETPGFIQP